MGARGAATAGTGCSGSPGNPSFRSEGPKGEGPSRPQNPSAPPSRRTLPIPLTALIGRDEDLRQVVSLAAQSRLLTLTGTGGVGKTRLAIRAAEELEANHADGAVFVDLAPLQNPD